MRRRWSFSVADAHSHFCHHLFDFWFDLTRTIMRGGVCCFGFLVLEDRDFWIFSPPKLVLELVLDSGLGLAK